MTTYNISLDDKEKEKALEAFLKALKMPFKKINDKDEKSPYDPEFVKKILESKKQIEEGKFTQFNNAEELKKHWGLDKI